MVSTCVSHPITVVVALSIATILVVTCQSTISNHSHEVVVTKRVDAKDVLSNQRISVSSFESDNRSLLEQLMAVAHDIRQRQQLQEQERQLGKLLELKQLEMLLKQQQSKNDEMGSVQRSIADDLKETRRLALNNSLEQINNERQQGHHHMDLLRELNSTQRIFHQQEQRYEATLVAAIS